MRRSIVQAAAAAMVLAFTGCAWIMHGSRQKVSIASSPTGAKVMVDGQQMGITPVNAELKRGEQHLVRIEMDGFLPFEIYLNRKASGWVWGNIALGGLIGLAVDAITGGLYNITPDQVQATLGKDAARSGMDGVRLVTVLRPEPGWVKIGQFRVDNRAAGKWR